MTAAADYEPVPTTVATWLFTLHVAGVLADDDAVRTRCQEVLDATEAEAGNAAGAALVERVRELLPSHEPGGVETLATQLYGNKVHTDLGAGDRSERSVRLRRWSFESQLPWLARVWERVDGTVQPSWLLVERVADEVWAADPNPWNDVAEERTIPVSDFQVLWELGECASVYVAR